jgi:hypothetical protein
VNPPEPTPEEQIKTLNEQLEMFRQCTRILLVSSLTMLQKKGHHAEAGEIEAFARQLGFIPQGATLLQPRRPAANSPNRTKRRSAAKSTRKGKK